MAGLLFKPGDPRNKKKPKKKKALGKTRRELNTRAKIIIQEIINGANETAALKAAGYSKSYAETHQTEILSNPKIQRAFTAILASAGVTDDFLATKIRALADAKEKKFFSDKGVITDTCEVDALAIQADMVKFAAKLRGHVIERSASLNVNVDVAPVDLSRWDNSVSSGGSDTSEGDPEAGPGRENHGSE